jgi:hypothetical protein
LPFKCDLQRYTKAGHVKMCGFRDLDNPRGVGVGEKDDTVEARIKEEIERHTRRRRRR